MHGVVLYLHVYTYNEAFWFLPQHKLFSTVWCWDFVSGDGLAGELVASKPAILIM